MKHNNLFHFILPFAAIAIMTASCHNNNKGGERSADTTSNPLLVKSTLPFGAPAFDKIKDADYRPAFEEGIKQELAEIDRVANNTDAPTFENTLVALEKCGQLLNNVNGVFNLVSGANTNPTLEKLQEDIAPKLTNIQDAIYLNSKLFKKVKTLYKQKDKLNLDAESARLV